MANRPIFIATNNKHKLFEEKNIEFKFFNGFSASQKSKSIVSLHQSAKEFFHYQITQTNDIANRFKYYAIFDWLNSTQPKRLLGCLWKEEGITLDARGELYYCAVASDSIGSLRKESGKKIFFDDKNIEYRKSIIKNSCDGCIHDYSGIPESKNVWIFIVDMLKNRFALKMYEIKLRFL